MFKIKNFSIVPKFFILLLDLGATLLALFIAILIQFNVTVKLVNWNNVVNAMVLITLINSLVFIVTKSYTGIVRYTGVQDALRILLAIASSSFLILVINTLALGYGSILSLTTLIIVLYTIFSFLFLISYRVLVRYLFAYAKNYKMKKKTVVIFGAADTGVATQRVLENDSQANIQVLAFIDDDKKKGSKNLNGAPIITFNAFKELGAEPVAMNFGEVYTALQSGTIEGQENPLPTIVGFSLQEVQKFISLTEHVRAPEFIYVNARWWKALDSRVRDLLTTLFAEGKKVAAQAIMSQQQSNIDSIKKAGASINEVDVAAFRAKAKPILDRIGPQYLGADTYSAIVRAGQQ